MDLYLDNECRCGQINQSTKSEGILVKILKFPVETYQRFLLELILFLFSLDCITREPGLCFIFYSYCGRSKFNES